jgi:hypothetical protein
LKPHFSKEFLFSQGKLVYFALKNRNPLGKWCPHFP